MNQLQKLGHSLGVARGVVNELRCECDEAGFGHIWKVMGLPVDEVLHSLDDRANGSADELRQARQKWTEAAPHPDGPEEMERKGKEFSVFWWRGEPYPLSPRECRLASVLWAAPERLLPLWEVLQKVWDDRPGAIRESNVHTLRQLASNVGKSLMGSGITVPVKKDQLGYDRVWLELP